MPGSRYVEVDLASQSAKVIFDPELASVAAFRDAIDQAGFPPSSESLAEN